MQALRGELEATRVMAAPAPPLPPPRRAVWPWVLAGVIAVVVLLAVLWATGVFATKVTVPNVAGMSLTQATTKLDGAGLKAGAVSYQQATGKAQGTVLSQSPTAGASVKKGSAVALVAVGTSVRAVPNVVGMTDPRLPPLCRKRACSSATCPMSTAVPRRTARSRARRRPRG